MNTPQRFVRTLTAAERSALEAGRKSADAFTVRRSQILLASADRVGPAAIGRVHGPGRPERDPGVPRRRSVVPGRPVPRSERPRPDLGPEAGRGSEGSAPPPPSGV